MCKFFSLVTTDRHAIYYFNCKQRKNKIFDRRGNPLRPDSHASICSYYGLDEDAVNKYEWNPFDNELILDTEQFDEDTAYILDHLNAQDWTPICGDLEGARKFIAGLKGVRWLKPDPDYEIPSGVKMFEDYDAAWVAAHTAAPAAARDAACAAAWDTAWNAAYDTARNTACAAAYDAACAAAYDAACTAARNAARNAARGAARGAAWDTALYLSLIHIYAVNPTKSMLCVCLRSSKKSRAGWKKFRKELDGLLFLFKEELQCEPPHASVCLLPRKSEWNNL